MKFEFVTHSEEETFQLGRKIARELKPNTVLTFYGDLAAGKTTFIKGLAFQIGGIDTNEVNSPTFTYLNIYEGLKTLYHFDLYRLEGYQDFLKMGFDEYLNADGICCIEWSERIRTHLPTDRIDIFIEHFQGSRKITIELKNVELCI